MAESDHPPDIFNTRYFGPQPLASPAPGADLGFPQFARLPRELRLQIWTWHLRRRRFLRVFLDEGSQHGDDSEYESGADDDDEWGPVFAAGHETGDTSSPAASPTAPPPLRVTFIGDASPAMPALRTTCHEAREAHNSVYRIRFPALTRIHRGYDYKTSRTAAYLSPELDILSVHALCPPEIVTRNLLPLFLHHLVRHDSSPDPLRSGARHLALDLRGLHPDRERAAAAAGGPYGSGPGGGRPAPELAPDVLASARLTFSNLRGLYLRVTDSLIPSRVVSGPLAGTRSFPWFNASLPLLPASSWAGCFPGAVVEPVVSGPGGAGGGGGGGGDPRLACPEGAHDLRQVWVGGEVRHALDVWAGLGRAWGVLPPAGPGPGPGTHVRALLGLEMEGWALGRMNLGGQVSSLGAFLREERASWESLVDPASEMGGVLREIFERAQEALIPHRGGGGGSPDEAPEEWIARRQPQTAVGFWLVDPEVLGSAAGETTGPVGGQRVPLSQRVRPEDIDLWMFRGH